MLHAEALVGGTDASLRLPGSRRHRYACRSHVNAKSTGAHRNQITLQRAAVDTRRRPQVHYAMMTIKGALRLSQNR